MSDLTPAKLDELRRLAATAADATTERTPWYSADDLLTYGVESEDDAPYFAALTPPTVLALLEAATERDALAAELAHMTEARDNARAEVERLTAQIEAAKRIGLGTHLGRPWASVLNDVLRALDATPETGGES